MLVKLSTIRRFYFGLTRTMTSAQTLTLQVNADDAGNRLDRWLAEAADGLSRSRVQALIQDGKLQGPGGDVVSDASRKVRDGETFVLHIPAPTPARPQAEDIPLEVLHEDSDLIVINKPPGLVVHPAPGHYTGTLVNALLHHCRGSLSGIGGVTRPGIVHRLDKDTAGVMVCAKSDIAHRGLVDQFQVHSIERAYQAVVWGLPQPTKGRIENRIGRDPRNRKRMAVVDGGGKEAITDYKVIRKIGSVASLVDCHLFTGRTHQIRVHLTSLGHPLVGDVTYQGRASAKRNRDPVIQSALQTYPYQALQAYLLGFKHPATGKHIRISIKLSKEINGLIDSLEEL